MDQLELIGGEVCLDFANSLGGTREAPSERLHGYGDLVRWAAHAGAIDESEVRPLLTAAQARSAEADAVFARARELRETIFRIFSAVADDANPRAADLERLNDELARALPHLRIVPDEHGFDYRFDAADGALDRPLWPVARSASELLATGDLARVKRCTSDECDWLFVDLSKNRSRRWCDMRDCGNRAKARRYYRRQRATRTS
ncbi:MAG TPA: ABATE domain-containing protein [Gemmatimonadota bacterium]|nr:ABATE domain-containing protein [Gemmatimonadota bacterium]